MSSAPIEFFYDVASPYSYLAFTQLPGLRQRTRRLVRPRAFLLGGVFKLSGNHMPASVPAKGRYLFQDCKRWALHYGVPFELNSRFPSNSLRAQRILVAAEREDPALAERIAEEFFRGYWTDDGDLEDQDFLAQALTQAGAQADVFLAASSDPEVKGALLTQTQEAVDRGAFGAPTWFVEEAMFWGNDRLVLLEEYILKTGP